MRNSTIEKLKEIMRGEDILITDKLRFAKMILNDLDCPISILTNKQCFLEELELYKFESKDTNTIIEKTATSIIGEIDYSLQVETKLHNFTEIKKVPRMIGTNINNMVYIEETKTVLVNGALSKSILDKKIILFLNQQVHNLNNNHDHRCYIIAQ